jgi:hypothetical protein
MGYLLYRMPTPNAPLSKGTELGRYETFELALEARDDDTVRLLSETGDGKVLLACHQIVDPDALLNLRQTPLISEIPRRVDALYPTADLEETRRWLAEIHGALG